MHYWMAVKERDGERDEGRGGRIFATNLVSLPFVHHFLWSMGISFVLYRRSERVREKERKRKNKIGFKKITFKTGFIAFFARFLACVAFERCFSWKKISPFSFNFYCDAENLPKKFPSGMFCVFSGEFIKQMFCMYKVKISSSNVEECRQFVLFLTKFSSEISEKFINSWLWATKAFSSNSKI